MHIASYEFTKPEESAECPRPSPRGWGLETRLAGCESLHSQLVGFFCTTASAKLCHLNLLVTSDSSSWIATGWDVAAERRKL